MATMGFRWSGIGNSYAKDYPNDGGNDFAANDLIGLDTSGRVTIATDSNIFGVALKAPGGTTTTTQIPVQVITPDSVWIAQVDTTSAQTVVGEDFGLNYTSGSAAVDLGDTTTTKVRIEQLDTRDGAKAAGRVYVRFKLDGTLKDMG